MKFVKKLAMAVTTVAICCTTTLPSVANAGNTSCITHEYIITGRYSIKYGAYSDHTYATNIVKDENGNIIDSDTAICRLDLIEKHYIMECSYCGVEKDEVYDTDLVHRSCGKPTE